MATDQLLYLKTTAPTANDDSSAGYKVLDIWGDTTNDLIYQAIDVSVGVAVWIEIVGRTLTQTITNKTLTSPVLTTPQINDTSLDHQYVFVPSELAADRNVTLPLLTGADEFTFNAHTQTLTNKTLTTPTIASFTNATHTHENAAGGGGALSGWTELSESWSYASASTITVSSDATTRFTKGVKIRFKQGGAYKYYVGTTIAATLITVAINTDYTVANSAITDIAVSYLANPTGFPTTFAILPTVEGLSAAGAGTYSVQTGIYTPIGSVIYFNISAVWSAHTGTGDMIVRGLPATAANTFAVPCMILWSSMTLTGTAYKLMSQVQPNTNYIQLFQVESGAAGVVAIDSAATLRLAGFYFI